MLLKLEGVRKSCLFSRGAVQLQFSSRRLSPRNCNRVSKGGFCWLCARRSGEFPHCFSVRHAR